MTEETSNYILNSSREYSLYVCSNRAIPKVTDGLKEFLSPTKEHAEWLVSKLNGE